MSPETNGATGQHGPGSWSRRALRNTSGRGILTGTTQQADDETVLPHQEPRRHPSSGPITKGRSVSPGALQGDDMEVNRVLKCPRG